MIVYFMTGINIKNLDDIIQKEIKSCETCNKYNPKRARKFIFVTAYEAGEKFGIDIIEPLQNKYIITGIDYFSRKGFAKLVTSRRDDKIVKFLSDIETDLKIRMLVLDQSKENLSNKLKNYAKSRNIELHYTSPFHHQSNGRVERFNRTLQDLIYKNSQEKLLNCKVKRALSVYNQSYHTGVQMSPNEAIKKENENKVKIVQYQNIKKFQELNKHLNKEDIFKKK